MVPDISEDEGAIGYDAGTYDDDTAQAAQESSENISVQPESDCVMLTLDIKLI